MKTFKEKVINFIEPEKIKKGYENFLKYIRVNTKICIKTIKKFIRDFVDRFKFYTYYYWYFKNFESYLMDIYYHKHDHFFELIQIINGKLRLMKKELEKDIDFDPKDMERLNDIIKIGDHLLEIIKQEGLVEKNQEYQKLAKSYFNKLYRLHDKLYSIKEFQKENL